MADTDRSRGPRENESLAAWAPPAELDDYTILKPLGQGGMGRVYLAEDVVLAREVAIKFVATSPPDVITRQRFLLEARAAARIRHPNVAGVYRAGDHEGIPYLVSELVRGRPLEDLPKPVPWLEALDIATQLARGLAAAHREGVLHRDIKPGNVLRTTEGEVRLIDFGLATITAAPSRVEVRTGPMPEERDSSIVRRTGRGPEGTLDFIAPELWLGDPPSRRSDIYAFGVLAFELCTGRTPFDDVPPEEVPDTSIASDAPPLATVAPSVDARLAALVDRCLRRDPTQRFASMDEVRDALEAIGRRATSTPAPGHNPYRGLRAFQAEHRALFFGRGAEISAVLDRLRAESFLLVTGDSGVGKSSLCRAGVLPAILDGVLGDGRKWKTCTVVPGRHPLAALVASVSLKLGVSARELTAALRDDRAALARAIARHAGSGGGLLILLDQAEELVTLADPEEARSAIEALAVIAAGTPGARVLGTIRADFLARFAALPPVVDDLARTLYFLRPMGADRLREVIVGPAEIQGARFESEETITELVETAAAAQGGLPLLQFVLAKLWDLRRPDGEIPASALQVLGGARGALARHADEVLAGMDQAGRLAVHRLLSRMVTLEGTRARKTAEQLSANVEPMRSALEALVTGRIVVALETPEGSAYEIAHEVLVQQWQTLAQWLTENAERRRVNERLTLAARQWHDRGRRAHLLWSAADLADAGLLVEGDFTASEREFVVASRQRARRTRILRWATVAMVPTLALGAYVAAVVSQRRAVDAQVAAHTRLAADALRTAQAAHADVDRLRAEAFAAFDAKDQPRGEVVWQSARARTVDTERAYATTSHELEGALTLDGTRADVRALLADVLLDRALLDDELNRSDARDESVARLALYDGDGSRRARWAAPAQISIVTDPPGAIVRIQRQDVVQSRVQPSPARSLGPTPIEGHAEEAGSYLLEIESPGRAVTRLPFVAERGAEQKITVDLRPATVLPGFVYVPAGVSLFGTFADEDARVGFFATVPAHRVTVPGFYVARRETTWGAWLDYLRALPPEERAARSPQVGPSQIVRLRELAGGDWELTLVPIDQPFVARVGQPMVDARRATRSERSWANLPVLGVSAEDINAYAAWLRATGRVPGARLCDEHEWERASRGADGRNYPHGWSLAPDDANYDATYAHTGIGPDEVGSHPLSQSPFGADDMSGNANEWAVSALAANQLVVRGGSYFHDQKTAQLVNRTVVSASMHDGTVGFRLCADLPR